MTPHDQAPEHEFEAAPGLPERLPSNERVLWQGAPEWRQLAREAMHTRALSVYFAVLLAVRGTTVLVNGGSGLDALVAVLWLVPVAVLAIAVLSAMAWLISRTSVYTITDRRVVMRIGVVLSITFNLPYSRIESAGLRRNADGSGDLTLMLEPSDQIAYVHLWPHARPWQLKRSQPMLRALPDAGAVAAILSTALANATGSAGAPRTPVSAVPAHQPALQPTPQPARQPAGNAGQRALAA